MTTAVDTTQIYPELFDIGSKLRLLRALPEWQALDESARNHIVQAILHLDNAQKLIGGA